MKVLRMLRNERWTPATRYFVVGLILVFIVFVGWQIREIFAPLITAGLIAYIFYPFVEIFRRRFHLRQGVAAAHRLFFAGLADAHAGARPGCGGERSFKNR